MPCQIQSKLVAWVRLYHHRILAFGISAVVSDDMIRAVPNISKICLRESGRWNVALKISNTANDAPRSVGLAVRA